MLGGIQKGVSFIFNYLCSRKSLGNISKGFCNTVLDKGFTCTGSLNDIIIYPFLRLKFY
ncbi:hypothetical protein SCG7109_BU_00010 [Chlamydiales bacterium SCGC AG-110-M15]|nr:hypothetical protein SCG7109_BU_00010 [Chlamydiales bacterium SCGC AG-110-M15]